MKQYYLGIEFGSTRVKAVLIDGEHRIVKSGDYTWKSSLENGVWTYHMEDVQTGLRTAIRNLGELPGAVSAMGISGMMHGYLAFDKDWNLLAPFRTWQNTMTGEAAEQLTAEFGFNIPQRIRPFRTAKRTSKISRTSRRLPDMSTICSRAKTFSAWAKPPVCSPLTVKRWTMTRRCSKNSTRCWPNTASRGRPAASCPRS